jgi:P2 family phage contractile tail tube protein
MSMQLPRVLKDFNVYANGTALLGRASSFQPPSIKVELEEARHSGTDGKISHDMGMDTMEAKLKMAELTPELAALVGRIDEVPVTCYGYAESPTGETMEVSFVMRGKFVEQNTGDIESGKKTDIDFTFRATAYKEIVGGNATKDIDFIAGRRIIGGKDVLQQKRRALKM